MKNRENETFRYSYSATEQSEIQRIRQKYIAPEETSYEKSRIK